MAHKRPLDDSGGGNDDSEEKRQRINLQRFLLRAIFLYTSVDDFISRLNMPFFFCWYLLVFLCPLFRSSALESMKSNTMQMFWVVLEPMLRRVVLFWFPHLYKFSTLRFKFIWKYHNLCMKWWAFMRKYHNLKELCGTELIYIMSYVASFINVKLASLKLFDQCFGEWRFYVPNNWTFYSLLIDTLLRANWVRDCQALWGCWTHVSRLSELSLTSLEGHPHQETSALLRLKC